MHDSRPSTPLQVVHDGLDAALDADLSGLTNNELLDLVADAYRVEARSTAVKAKAIAEMEARDDTRPWARSRRPRSSPTAAMCRRARPGATCWWRGPCATYPRPEPASRTATWARPRPRRSPGVSATRAPPRRPRPTRRCWPKKAATLPYRLFSAAVAYWIQFADPDGTDAEAEERAARRHLHLSRTFEGMWVLDGLLDPVAGAAVDEALHRISEELRHAETDPLQRSAAQRRADTLVELAHRASCTRPSARRPKPLVSVFVGYETFAGVCELADGTVSHLPTCPRCWMKR